MLSPVAPAPSTVGLLPPSLPSLLPMPSLLQRPLPLPLLQLLLLPLLRLLLVLLLGGILSLPPNEPPRDTTVEGDEGLLPPRNGVPVGLVVSGSLPAATSTPWQLPSRPPISLQGRHRCPKLV